MKPATGRERKRTAKDVGDVDGLVAAHEDVEMDVGLGEGGHVWVLRDCEARWRSADGEARTVDTSLRSISWRMGRCKP